MKKTLLITVDFHPSTGGIANYWKELGARMPQDAWMVVAPENNDQRVLKADYPIHRISFSSRWIWPRWLPAVFALRRLIRSENIERIIVGQVLPVGVMVRVCRYLGVKIPYSVSAHGTDIARAALHPRKRQLAEWVLRGADKVIVNSHYTQALLQSRYGVAQDKILLVYPCPSLDQEGELSQEDEVLMRTLAGKRVVLSVGRLIERKGFDSLLHAALRLKDEPIAWVVVGEGPMKETYENFIEKNGLSNVYCIGRREGSALRKWFERCTVFALAPYEIPELQGDVESFGMVYLEAAACGRPSVGTKTGGVAEAILDGKTGVLVPQQDPDALAGAVLKVINDPLWALQLGMQGKKRVEEEFRWENGAKKIIDLCS